MEQLFLAGKAYLKINALVKTPLHEFMAVERSGLWAPGYVHIIPGGFYAGKQTIPDRASVHI